MIEGSFSEAELEGLEEAAMSEEREDTPIVATLKAIPTDLKDEMHIEWDWAIEIVFDADRLPDTLPMGGPQRPPDGLPGLARSCPRSAR